MVLAATFAVLTVFPLVLTAEFGILVAFGVLLDTLLARSVLVPAIVLLMGPSTIGYMADALHQTVDKLQKELDEVKASLRGPQP